MTEVGSDLPLDRGQIFHLVGAPNDEVLDRLRFWLKVPNLARIVECGHCQKKFIDPGSRDGHAEFRHGIAVHTQESERVVQEVYARANQMIAGSAGMSDDKTTMSDGEAIERVLRADPDLGRRYHEATQNIIREEQAIDHQENLADKISPLRLDRTKASIESGDAAVEVKTQKRGKKVKAKRGRPRAEA